MVSWMVMWNCESELNLICKKKSVATTSQAPIYRPDDEFHLLVLWDFFYVWLVFFGVV